MGFPLSHTPQAALLSGSVVGIPSISWLSLTTIHSTLVVVVGVVFLKHSVRHVFVLVVVLQDNKAHVKKPLVTFPPR